MVKNFASPKHFEELNVGDVFVTPGRTVTECDIRQFAMLAGAFEEIFTNHEYALKESVFKARVAQGPLTLLLAMGLNLQAGWVHGTIQAFLGIDDMRILRPTYVNDTIHMEIELVEKRDSRSRPDAGLVKTRNTVLNQRGEPLQTYYWTAMIAKREDAAVSRE